MGEHNVRIASTHEEARSFMDTLLKDLEALDYMIGHGMIESNMKRIGAEQEIFLVDSSYRPAPIVMEILAAINDGHFTTEHARFNAEINLDPLPFESSCLSLMEKQLADLVNKARSSLKRFNADLIYTGILPTITRNDLRDENLTPEARYSILASVYDKLRGEPFNIHIEGTDQLITQQYSTMFEGSNTSFQIHLQVNAQNFNKLYNWAQLISGPVLACATNSPLFLGKRLWRETRIALFEQSIDTRRITYDIVERTPRVFFGHQWIKESALEIFQEDIVRHRVIFNSYVHEDAFEQLEKGLIPRLKALNIHNGTVYRWNRPCYGITLGKPHLRIETRYLPSGPSLQDQVANSAFWLGLMNGMPRKYANIHELMDFDKAKSNFIKAAKMGLGAQFSWPGHNRISATELILDKLLPIAEKGLSKAKVSRKDIAKYLNIIKERVQTGKTGSQWILDSYNKLRKEGTMGEALVAVAGSIVKNQKENVPVHNWELANINDAGSWKNRYWQVGQFMSTDVFTVREEDIVKLVADIMKWKHIRHVPVENNEGEFTGLVTSGMLLEYFGFRENTPDIPIPVKKIMIKNPIAVSPETTTDEAINLLLKNKIGCLPVVRGRQLLGIVTEHDFVNMSKRLLDEFKPND